MIPWVQLIAFFPLAFVSILLGRRLAKAWLWWIAIIPSMLFVTLVILGHRSMYLSFFPPITWAIDATTSPFVMTPVIAIMMFTLIGRLPRRRTRVVVTTGTFAILVHYGLIPGLMPLLVRPALLATQTQIDSRGVCLQTHDYTCGPAAAVTCLRHLGISAEEGEIAIEARCAPALGTDPRLLAQTLSRHCAPAGLECEYRWIDSLDSLSVPAIADMSTPLVGGHYVAVLEVRADTVLVADPYSGLRVASRADFLAAWKHTAHVFVPVGSLRQ